LVSRARPGGPSSLGDDCQCSPDRTRRSTRLRSSRTLPLRQSGRADCPFFLPSIYEGSALRRLYGADFVILQGLQRYCDGLIVGDAKQSQSKDAELQDLSTTRSSISVRLFSTRPPMIRDEFVLSARGGGFSNDTSAEQAAERLATELKERISQELQKEKIR